MKHCNLILIPLFLFAIRLTAASPVSLDTQGTVIQVPAGIVTIGNLTIPAGKTLRFAPGAKLQIPKGVTLTINGMIEAGMETIFTGDGVVAGRPANRDIFPEWFGARGDDKTECGPAFQKAGDLARFCAGRRLHIGRGRYRFSGIIIWRCNVNCMGTLVKTVNPVPQKHYANTYQPHWVDRRATRIVFEADGRKYRLDPTMFTGIGKGDSAIARTTKIPLADSQQTVDLQKGGTLAFESSDYFTSRANGKGDEFYTPTDLVRIESADGKVYPPFAFAYPDRSGAKEWNADTVYQKGEVVRVGKKMFKAAFLSGPETVFHDRFRGDFKLGAHSPAKGDYFTLKLADGKTDRIRLWTPIVNRVTYSQPQGPVRIKGLKIELLSASSEPDIKPLYDTTIFCYRSNMTFENCSFVCKDKRILPAVLVSLAHTTGNVFKNCVFSGACYNSRGYNISIYNTIDTKLLNCKSDNCRDAVSGRHNKNALIDGGFYNRIDDHYGINFNIRNVEFNSLSTWVPGFRTPKCDVQKWAFRPSWSVVYAGSGLTVENCKISNARGVICNRADVGDFGGKVAVRNIRIDNKTPFELIHYDLERDFDYVHIPLVPDSVTFDQISSVGSGTMNLMLRGNPKHPFTIKLSNSGPFAEVDSTGIALDFVNCVFDRTKFLLHEAPVKFQGSRVNGVCVGADPAK